MSIRIQKILLILFFVSTSQSVMAVDDNRKGFVLGLGIGIHQSTVASEYGQFSLPDEKDVDGVATSFRVGGGINNQFLIYYSNDVNWFNLGGQFTVAGNTAFGMSYYFSPEPNTIYVNGAIGIGSLVGIASNSNQNSDNYIGTSASLGVGYEFKKWFSFQLDWLVSDMQDSGDSRFKKDTDGYRLTFQTNFY